MMLFFWIPLFIVCGLSITNWYLKNNLRSLWFPNSKELIDPFQSVSTALLVTAHPDDECLFFTPTILALMNRGIKIYLLCLSIGDTENKSYIRIRELIRSGRLMGISPNQIAVINHPKLVDGQDWDPLIISNLIEKSVTVTGSTHIITFDDYGVSGHSNHGIISEALRYAQFTQFYVKF